MTREKTIKEIRKSIKTTRDMLKSMSCGWFWINNLHFNLLNPDNTPAVLLEFDEDILYIWSINKFKQKDHIVLSISYTDIEKIN